MAEELARRGKAVDPSAKFVVRIELSSAKRDQVKKSTTIQFVGHVPPGELKSVYRIEGRTYLINRENGSKCPIPTVSLYVNDWNESARRVYAKVGFVETARFSTVMF